MLVKYRCYFMKYSIRFLGINAAEGLETVCKKPQSLTDNCDASSLRKPCVEGSPACRPRASPPTGRPQQVQVVPKGRGGARMKFRWGSPRHRTAALAREESACVRPAQAVGGVAVPGLAHSCDPLGFGPGTHPPQGPASCPADTGAHAVRKGTGSVRAAGSRAP